MLALALRCPLVLLLAGHAMAASCVTEQCASFWKKGAEAKFFDKRTFGRDQKFPEGECEPMTKEQFADRIKVKCKGKLCGPSNKKNGFNCGNSKTRQSCYHVEHIIDHNGPEFPRFSGNEKPGGKNIAGNYVMAWGEWNVALGRKNGGTANTRTTRAKYDAMMKEKEMIYGKRSVEAARKAIRKCNNLAKKEL